MKPNLWTHIRFIMAANLLMLVCMVAPTGRDSEELWVDMLKGVDSNLSPVDRKNLKRVYDRATANS